MQLWGQLAIIGLIIGATYALAALGLVVTYNGSGVINFAHLATGTVGAYVYANWVNDGKNKWVGLILGLAAGALLGLVVHQLVIRSLRLAPTLAKLVATFGALAVIQGLTILRWGANPVTVEGLFSRDAYQFGLLGNTFTIGKDVIITTLLAVAVAGVAHVLLTRTTTGRAIQASAINERSAMRLGYRPNRLGMLTWASGGALGALAAIIIVPSLGLTPGILSGALVAALAAALVGGFRSIWLTVAGAFALGIGQSVLVGYVSTPGVRDALPFFVIAAFLLIRSQAIPARDTIVTERLPALPPLRINPALVIGGVAALVILPLVFSEFWVFVFSIGVALVPVALSIVMLTGWLGQISLAQFALAAFGAFTAADLAIDGWSMVPAIVVAALMAFPLGVLIGFPALRVRGPNLAILSLGAAIAIQSLYLKRRWGLQELEVPQPDLFGADLSDRAMTYLSIVCVLLMCVALFALRRTRYGKQMTAVRVSERAATASGIAVRRTKLVTFGVASSLAAFGGGLWGFTRGTLSTDGLDAFAGVQQLMAVMVTGVGSLAGGVMAGTSNSMGPPFFNDNLGISPVWFTVVSGVLVILTLKLHPDGAFVVAHRRKRRDRAAAPAGDAGEPVAVSIPVVAELAESTSDEAMTMAPTAKAEDPT